MTEQTAIVLGDKTGLNNFINREETQKALKALANKYITAERISKMMLLSSSRQPKLYKCTPKSFFDACAKSAELGLDFGGATGQAYLVPFKNGKLSERYGQEVYECTFIPGYQGLIELVYRSGNATYVDAQLVYKKDKFEYNLGSEPSVRFQPCLDDDRGEIICAFAVVRLKDSQFPKIEIMTKKDLLAVKARSKAKDSGPWKTDEGEMMRKTVVRRTLKFIPKTPEIDEAIEADNEIFDYPIQIEEDQAAGVAGVKKRIKKHVTSKDKTKPAPTARGLKNQQKAKEQAEKLKKGAENQQPMTTEEVEKNAEEKLSNKVYTCTGENYPECECKNKKLIPDKDNLEWSVGDNAYICPGCGYLLTEVKD